MTEKGKAPDSASTTPPEKVNTPESAPAEPTLHIAPSPHMRESGYTTRRMMVDVLIALTPTTAAAIFFYHQWAIIQLLLCVGGCLVTEAVFTHARKRKLSLGDLSAVVTGVILALSLPWNTPWFISLIASVVAISLGKMIFGGLGMNLFNPAMVGRTFVMLAFAGAVGAPAYVVGVDRNPGNETIVTVADHTALDGSALDGISSATPLTAHKQNGTDIPVGWLVLSSCYSSLGERGIFVLIGGFFLLMRRTISWRIPLGAIISVALIAGIRDLAGYSDGWTITHHLFSGAFFLGAFFILTDPVTSPVTSKGRWIFGLLFGALVMLLRILSNYPEGVMFSILLVNALVPLINRWTIPKPFGGVVPQRT